MDASQVDIDCNDANADIHVSLGDTQLLAFGLITICWISTVMQYNPAMSSADDTEWLSSLNMIDSLVRIFFDVDHVVGYVTE